MSLQTTCSAPVLPESLLSPQEMEALLHGIFPITACPSDFNQAGSAEVASDRAPERAVLHPRPQAQRAVPVWG